ncbi:MAG: LptF/LptG family permease [Alphaproteobacteria bacterium]|nr:LptF/LptG family permease [Alphaproteobacteria bacterium]
MAISGAFSPRAAPVRPRARGLKPPRLSFYVFRQLLGPVVMLGFLLTSMIWLVEILPLLDLVINRGQSAVTFAYLAFLYLPALLVIILPLSFLFGGLFALQRLSSDSELVVMASAGYSLRQLAMPVLTAAALVAASTWACNLYLAPAGQRALNAKKGDIYADVGGALLNEGQFNPAAKGLTVFIKQISTDGAFKGILVHDGREVKRPITFIADSGQLLQTPAGARLLMYNGTLQSGSGQQLATLSFKSYPLNLDQFAAQARDTLRRPDDRFLPELLWPPEKNLPQRTRDIFTAEAHNRLSQPLYCFAFALIALATVARGRRQRGLRALRLIGGALAAVGLFLGGTALAGAAQSHSALLPGLYVLPFAGMAGALLVLTGYSPAAMRARRARKAAA